MALSPALAVFPDQTTTVISADLDHLQAIGAKTVWVNVDITWAFPSSTTIDSTVAAKYDAIINGAQTRGMSVTLQAHGNPSWIVTAGGHTYPGNIWHGPDNASERGNWVSCLHNFINRYGASKISWVEIWNEPNLTQFWVQGYNYSDYVRLLQASYVDIKATWPTIKVVGHVVSRNHDGWLAQCYQWTDTIFGSSTAAANKYYFDVLGIHPYCGNSSSGYDPSDTSHGTTTDVDGGLVYEDYTGYRQLRSRTATKEGTAKPLAFGEFGYATLGAGWFKVTETQRAAYIPSAMYLANSDGYVEYLAPYYHWRHETPTDYATSFNIHSTSTETAFTTAANAITTTASAIYSYKVEVAFTTDPLAITPSWTDITDYVIFQEGELQITRGAPDEFSAVQPSTLSIWLDNSTGRFTRGLSTSPYYPNVKNGKRIRVSTTYNGVTYRRFDGHVNAWPTAWKVTGSNPYIPVQITGVDRFDRLNKRGELRSVIEEEYLRDVVAPELLQYPDGTFEAGTIGDWSAGGGFSSAIASTEQARTGQYSMKITADGTSIIWIKNDSTGNHAARVKPGEKISGGAWIRPFSTVRAWHFVLRYGDASSNYVTQSDGPYITQAAGTWTYVSFLNQIVPAGVASVYAQLETETTPANGEIHYVDDVSIRVGTRPAAYYPLSEASGSESAANIGPTPQGPLLVTTYTGDGDIDFGAGTGPGTDELSAPMFTPTSPTNGGKYLAGEFYNPPGGVTGLTIEAFVRAKRATNTRDIVAAETSFGRRAELSINSDGTLHGFTTGNNGVANYHLFSSTLVNNGSTHHVALTEHIRGTTVTARLFMDAQQVATTTYTDSAIEQYKNIYIAGEPVGGQLFEGTISHVAVYSTALGASRITQHARAGIMPGLAERTDQRIDRIADWIGIPVNDRALDFGDVNVGWQGTSGQQPVAAMQEAAETESPGSALFFSGDNKLTFHSQSRRANASVFLTLDAADAAQIGTELEFPGDDFGLFNDVTVERPREGQARWLNQTSIDTYGLYRTTVSGIHANDTDALATAQWIAENYGTPKERVPNVVCDLYVLATRTGGSWVTLVTTILQTEISKKIRLSNLPAQAPVATLDVFVEGSVETIGTATWTIEFQCSPGDFGNVWQLGIAGFSELGLTTILGL